MVNIFSKTTDPLFFYFSFLKVMSMQEDFSQYVKGNLKVLDILYRIIIYKENK